MMVGRAFVNMGFMDPQAWHFIKSGDAGGIMLDDWWGEWFIAVPFC